MRTSQIKYTLQSCAFGCVHPGFSLNNYKDVYMGYNLWREIACLIDPLCTHTRYMYDCAVYFELYGV